MKSMQTRLAVVFLFAAFAAAAAAAPAPRPTVDRFDEREAFAFLKRQVALGPRPAGSPASRRLAAILRATVPRGRYQPVPDGLRNVVATVPGRDPSKLVVVGAHYDTYDLPGFVGANDSASGTAVVRQLARTIKPRTVRPTLVFVFFDGEEAPPDTDFDSEGLRGSTVAARVFKRADSMVLLDFVGDRNLSIPREANSNRRLWRQLRAAAIRVGAGRVFPPRTGPTVTDDHIPFQQVGIPAIDLIDFDFPCWHRLCDDLSVVSVRSLDAVGETMVAFLRSL
jgi:glutaminyl-peptide cyclotransferase